jgi:hypothetical protein
MKKTALFFRTRVLLFLLLPALLQSCSPDDVNNPTRPSNKPPATANARIDFELYNRIKTDTFFLKLRKFSHELSEDAAYNKHNLWGKNFSKIVAAARKTKTKKDFDAVFVKAGIKDHKQYIKKTYYLLYLVSSLNKKYPELRSLSQQDRAALFKYNDDFVLDSKKVLSSLRKVKNNTSKP